jgi:hypothetical protein
VKRGTPQQGGLGNTSQSGSWGRGAAETRRDPPAGAESESQVNGAGSVRGSAAREMERGGGRRRTLGGIGGGAIGDLKSRG